MLFQIPWHIALAARYLVFTDRITGPIASVPIVLVESIFGVTAHGGLRIVNRGVLDCLACHRDCHSLVEPVHGVDPLWRDQNLVPEPPVARVEDEIAHGPRLLVRSSMPAT